MHESNGESFALGVLIALMVIAAVSGILFFISQRRNRPKRTIWHPEIDPDDMGGISLPADQSVRDGDADGDDDDPDTRRPVGKWTGTGVQQVKWECPGYDIPDSPRPDFRDLWIWCRADYKPLDQAEERHCDIMWLLWTTRIALEPYKTIHSVLTPGAVLELARGTLGLKVPLRKVAAGCAALFAKSDCEAERQKVVDYLLTFLRLRVFRDFQLMVVAYVQADQGCGLIEESRRISGEYRNEERRTKLGALFGYEPLIDEWLDYEVLVEAAYDMVNERLRCLAGTRARLPDPMPFGHWIWQVRVEMARAFCGYLLDSRLTVAPLPLPRLVNAMREEERFKHDATCEEGFALNGYADILPTVLKGRCPALNEDVVEETRRAVYRTYFFQGHPITPDLWEIYLFVGYLILWPEYHAKTIRYIHVQRTPHSQSIVRHDGYMSRMSDKNYLIGFRVDDDPNDFLQVLALDGFAPSHQFAGMSNALFGWQTGFETFEVGDAPCCPSAKPTYLVLDHDESAAINSKDVTTPIETVKRACGDSYVKLIKAKRGAKPALQSTMPVTPVERILDKMVPTQPVKVITREIFDLPSMTASALTGDEERAKNRLAAHPHAGMEVFLK